VGLGGEKEERGKGVPSIGILDEKEEARFVFNSSSRSGREEK